MRVAPEVELSPEERTVLLRWSRRAGPGDPRRRRARIVLAAAAGDEDIAIAARLKVNRLTVARWRQRFLASRLRGLEEEAAASLRSGRVPEETVRAILRQAGPGSAVGGSTRHLARRYGVSHTTVRRIWGAHRLRPASPAALPLRADPGTPLRAAELLGIYLRRPEYAVAVSLGPEPGQGVPSVPGPAPAPGTLVPLGAASALPGLIGSLPEPLSPPPPPPRSSERLTRFLAGLYRTVGDATEVRVLVSLPPNARAAEFRTWQLRHPNFRFELLHDFGEWKRRTSSVIQGLGWAPAGAGRRSARGESARSLVLALTSFRADRAPFEWIATAPEVRAGTAAPRLRYELSATGHPSFRLAEAPAPPTDGTEGEEAVRRMAQVVLRHSLRLRPGETVLVDGWSGTARESNALVLEALRLGAHPMYLFRDEPTYWAAATEVTPGRLGRLGRHQRAAIEQSDALVSFFGPSDRERFHALPRRVWSKLCEYDDAVFRAAARSRARAVQLALGRVSASSARMYGVDLATWRSELVQAAIVDPRELHRRGRRIFDALSHGRVLQLSHPNGTEVELRLRGRRPVLSDGIVRPVPAGRDWQMATLPAGVVTVALDERFAEGSYRSNVTSSTGLSGPVGELAGGHWTFAGGKLRAFDFERGRDVFAESYAGAGPGRDRPGTLSIGLNDRISISPLLEDQSAGTVTLQLGRSDHVGGSNHATWWAWLFLRGADVRVDGRRLVQGGRLLP